MQKKKKRRPFQYVSRVALSRVKRERSRGSLRNHEQFWCQAQN